MNGESRLPMTLVVSIIIVVAAVGIAAYFAGRFGGASRRAATERVELPEPADPVPAAVAEGVAAPAEIPPTVTPAVPVVVEKTTRSSKGLVERSAQIVVSVPPAPAARPASAPIEPGQPVAVRNRIVVEVRPTPTPTVPEIDVRAPPPSIETPIPPPPEPLPEETPEPEPEPTARPRIAVAPIEISEAESSRGLSDPGPLAALVRTNHGAADRPIGC